MGEGIEQSGVVRTVDPPVELIDLSGVRVPRTTLQEVLAALEETVFPDNGLVLGIVIDELGSPVANVQVEAEIEDVMTYPVVYLSASIRITTAENWHSGRLPDRPKVPVTSSPTLKPSIMGQLPLIENPPTDQSMVR